jgi:hypothetical protein
MLRNTNVFRKRAEKSIRGFEATTVNTELKEKHCNEC